MTRSLLFLALTLSTLATRTLAQQQVKIAGETSRECSNIANDVVGILSTFSKRDTPPKWTWVVICDADSWEQIFPGTWSTKVGQTQPETRFTYLNGSRLALSIPQGFTRAYVIAHELGHIMTRSSKEKDADAWASQRGYRWGHKDDPHDATFRD